MDGSDGNLVSVPLPPTLKHLTGVFVHRGFARFRVA